MKRAPWFLLPLALASTSCAAGTEVAADTEAVVYDTDDRTDVYAHADAELQRLARESIVAFVPRSNVDASDPANILLSADTLEVAFGVCSEERFSQQITAADCSGTLIADDLVLTVGHCVPSDAACRDFDYVFGYMLEADGVLGTITSDDVYACEERVAYSSGRDFAIIRLDRPVTGGHVPAPLRPGHTVLTQGTPVSMIGFGVGLPAKIDDGGEVLADRNDQRYFIASVDAFGGNSGSGVFDAEGRVVGMLSSGLDDFVANDTGECAVVNQVASPSVESAEGENIVYAWAAMHDLCRSEPELGVCGDPTSWCPDCKDGGCSVSAPGGGAGRSAGRLGLGLLALLVARRKLRH